MISIHTAKLLGVSAAGFWGVMRLGFAQVGGASVSATELITAVGTGGLLIALFRLVFVGIKNNQRSDSIYVKLTNDNARLVEAHAQLIVQVAMRDALIVQLGGEPLPSPPSIVKHAHEQEEEPS